MVAHKPFSLMCAFFLALFSSGPVEAGAGPIPHAVPQRHVSAQTAPTATVRPHDAEATAPTAEPGMDILLLIDSSGSMKRTDPGNYRKNAAKLFISLLGAGDRVGVMSFGDAASLLAPLTQNTERSKRALFSAVDKITSREFSTNITDAVQKGFDELRTSRSRNRIMVMMSDGRLALGSAEKDKAAAAALQTLLPELAKEKIALYTVAFTGESDRALLENAARATGGSFRFAKEDKDVHIMFASIFEAIKEPDTVPFEGEAFTLDSEIKEATVLVTKKEGTALALLDPSGGRHTAAKHAAHLAWFESSVFDMITIKAPAPGAWSVKLSANEGNKVYILTNLSLKTSFDKRSVNRDEQLALDAWLEKQGGIVAETEVLENTAFSAIIAGPDEKTATLDLVSGGSTTNREQSPARHSAGFAVPGAGEYTLTLRAQGKTFVREKTLSFTAVEPPAAPPVERKLEPLSAPPPAPAPAGEEVSWSTVLMKLGIINLLMALVAAATWLIRRKLSARRRK